MGLTRRSWLAGAAAGAALGLRPRSAGAVVSIDVTQGNIQPIPIAIPDFVGGTPNDAEVARNISQVITANLKRSGLFAPIDPQAYPRAGRQHRHLAALRRLARHPRPGAGHRPHHPAGRRTAEIGIPARGTWPRTSSSPGRSISPRPTSGGGSRTSSRMRSISGSPAKSGYFDSRVVFVDESGPKEQRIKRLAIMDQDGANVRTLTRGTDLVLTPRFCRRRKKSPTCPSRTACRGSICSISRPASARWSASSRHELRASVRA